MPPDLGNGPPGPPQPQGDATTTSRQQVAGTCESYGAGRQIHPWRRRRAASRRLEPLHCGCADPWPCRCSQPPPSRQWIDGYRDAALHLRRLGLLPAPLIPEMQVLWRRGGADRRLAQELYGLVGGVAS